MSTERFTRKDFEKALSATGLSYNCRGIIAGELRYHIAVHSTVIIEVASSIGESGFADDCGENSIRLWLSKDGMPAGSKISRWVTRVTGWQTRLQDQVERLAAMGREVKECRKCHSTVKIYISKTAKNPGRIFTKCNCANGFHWLDEVEQKEAPAAIQAAKKIISETKLFEDNQAEIKPVTIKPERVWSKYQVAIFDRILKAVKDGSELNLVVEAVAGSGKTSTGVRMLELLPTTLDILFCAFAKDIAKELATRAPKHVKVSTLHSLGFGVITRMVKNVQVDEHKVSRIVEGLLDMFTHGYLLPTICQVVSLMKATLCPETSDGIAELVDRFGIETNGDFDTIVEVACAALERSRHLTTVIDYDDMIYVPVWRKLPVHKHDVIFVDEAQDLNRSQIELVKMAVKKGGIVIAVGDRHQSIYGFRGADTDAIPNIISELNAETLPLSITYRCPRKVVELVNQKFPEIAFEAAQLAVDGTFKTVSMNVAEAEFTPGDMVLCRCNAPLVKPAFALIRRGVKAVILGRDIGKGLISLCRKMKATDVSDLVIKLTEYEEREVGKLQAANKGSQAQSVQDKVATLIALTDDVTSLTSLEMKIEGIFSEKADGVVFSSIHRAKGKEAQKVYILHPELMPHPMAKQPWEVVQERNMEYVAYTRALSELVLVSG